MSAILEIGAVAAVRPTEDKCGKARRSDGLQHVCGGRYRGLIRADRKAQFELNGGEVC